MKNFDLNNFMFGFFAIALISIGIWITYISLNRDEEIAPPRNELKIEKNVNDSVVNDTTIVEQKSNNFQPIKVVSVVRNTDKFIDGKWQVMTENGVMYYTNNTTYVGQIAFYLGNDGEIIENYG